MPRHVDYVIGLDLSLTAAAAAAIPRQWTNNLDDVKTMRVGYGLSDIEEEGERMDRLDFIVERIMEFCQQHSPVALGVEEYAYSQGQSRSHALGELGGVVKLAVWKRLHITPLPVVASTARKTLLQKLPNLRGKKKGYLKTWVVHNVQRLEGPTLRWTADEIDAFVIANHRLMMVGGMAMTYEPEEP
jgi:Holliday junction resolvasome RuvABC endonuclease subunit